MTALRQRLLDVFEVEYREHSEAIRRIVSGADSSGEGAAGLNLTEATRRAHSLKGAARAVGLGEVEELAHGLESLFIGVQRGEGALDQDARKHINDVLDQIEDLVVPPEAPASPRQTPIPASEPVGGSASSVTGSTGHAPRKTEDGPAKSQAESVRVKAEDLDHLLKSAGEIHADMLFQSVGAQEVRTISHSLAALETHWSHSLKLLERTLRSSEHSGSVRMLRVGEEISTQVKAVSKQLRTAAQRQTQGAKALRRHLDDLERRIMAARMVPAESVFGGFRKMVRDVAASEGKQVEVTVEGLDCEADRLVLQRIKDPVMHILRNAVSHGIELPDERRSKGKEPHGQVKLLVSGEHDRLRVAIEDDGRGIDFERIAAKAAEQNRLTDEEAKAANKESLYRFLFEPGFSTAESITTISGRGVGLSVAHETIADLHGSIEVNPRPGGGTIVEISLPVSILARRLLLVSLKDQIFALPAESIARVMRVALSDVTTLEGRPIVRLKDTSLPLTSIGELLNLGDTIVTTGRSAVSVVALRKGNAQLGVAVDSFIGVNDFVVRHFETGSRKRRRWMGLITTEDGAPALVLNADALLTAEAGRQSTVSFAARQDDAERTKVILVVDDSITTRTLEKSILEAHGYRVRLSVDGRDALAQLHSELPDVVISDVEMPHMDGFALLSAVKGNKKLSKVPMILVTSRSDPKDREKGLALGADAYVVKQRFDQNELLQTIRQII